ncbi:MAG TPA: M15 family metallopeptidase [Terriglobales bacterium]|nr:M15 family metallopeptidase [Terriglobales bacterium]
MMNLYSFCINNSTSNMDPDGRGVIPVQLPGVNGTTLTSWPDARFAQRVEAFIAFCKDIGIEVEVTSAYRSQKDQDTLVAMGLTKAKTSLHSAGWAIDINWNAFGSNELVEISVITAAAINGIDWGGYFRDPDVVHFYAEPQEDRATLIKCAIATIETYNAFGVGGLSDRELYMLYGVFTADAAYRAIAAAMDLLKN